MTNLTKILLIILLSFPILNNSTTNAEDINITNKSNIKLYIVMPNSSYIWKNNHDFKIVNDRVLSNLEKKYTKQPIEIIELSAEETKITSNYYLGYCLHPWGGFLEVLNKRKIDFEKQILIYTIHTAEQHKKSKLEANIYVYLDKTQFGREFEWIRGKLYSNIQPGAAKDLINRITAFINNEIETRVYP